MSFKIGNTVMLVPTPESDSFVAMHGALAQVIDTSKMPYYIRLAWYEGPFRNGQPNGEYYPKDFNFNYEEARKEWS